jgi:hypothetical protein
MLLERLHEMGCQSTTKPEIVTFTQKRRLWREIDTSTKTLKGQFSTRSTMDGHGGKAAATREESFVAYGTIPRAATELSAKPHSGAHPKVQQITLGRYDASLISAPMSIRHRHLPK